MARNIVTGIDVGTSTIRVVVAEFLKDKPAPTILAMVHKESRGLRRGYVLNLADATSCIAEVLEHAERVAKVRIKRAYVAIGGVSLGSSIAEGSVAVSRADAEVGAGDVERAIAASEANLRDSANRVVLHTIPQSFKLDGKKLLGRPHGMQGRVLEVRTLFLTCLEQHHHDLIGAVEAAGVGVDETVAAPMAESLSVLTKLQRTAGCLLVNIGAETVSMAVFEEGIPVSLQVFPIGSTNITNDIALGLKVSLEEAEEIKKRKQEIAAKKKVLEIVEARLSDIFDLVETHLKKIGKNGLLPAGIVLTGGGADIDDAVEFARATLKLPARIASPKEVRDPSWSVAYGLCLMGMDKESDDALGLTHFARQSATGVMRFLKNFLP